MLIEIHAVQNHSPANLNRDDLGAPKTCYFGGVLRSRISSQCLKRSIRMSPQFARLLGGIRTRQLAVLIARECPDLKDAQKRAEKILGICGLEPKKGKKRDSQSGTVYVLDGDEIRPVSVHIGITDNRNTEIVGGDLKEGDRVVTGENTSTNSKPSSVGMRMF